MYYFIEGEFPFQGSDRTQLRKMKNTDIDSNMKKIVTMMMEILPTNRPTLDDIIDLKIPFFTRLGLKKHPFSNGDDEF